MCEGKACPAAKAVSRFSIAPRALSEHHRVLLCGLLHDYITDNYLRRRVEYVDIPEQAQARFIEARTHAYAGLIVLYQDLGGTRRFPDEPAPLRFSTLDPADLVGLPVPK